VNGVDPDGRDWYKDLNTGKEINLVGVSGDVEGYEFLRADNLAMQLAALEISADFSSNTARSMRSARELGIYRGHAAFLENDLTQFTIFGLGFLSGGSEAFLLGRMGHYAKGLKFVSKANKVWNSAVTKTVLEADMKLNQGKRYLIDWLTPEKRTYVKIMNKNRITKSIHRRLVSFYHKDHAIINTQNVDKALKIRRDMSLIINNID
jgi:hypothetical protein